MYADHFGFTEPPFSIAPDPRYLYLSEKHREALAHLLFGVSDQGGFILLTGEVGTGKTTVCRCLLQQMPASANAALILNPRQDSRELLQSILREFGVETRAQTSAGMVDELNDFLLEEHARGRNSILIVDEAQNLSIEVLEQLRLLTNLETNEKKLLQLILLGQPELNRKLQQPELRQLAQRVTARYHLAPLSRPEVERYIEHRLAVAGARQRIFNPGALRSIWRRTRGIPRLINLLCDRALLGAYAHGQTGVNRGIVRRAAKESLPANTAGRRAAWLALGSVLFAAIAVGLWQMQSQRSGPVDGAALSTTMTVQSAPVESEAVQSAPGRSAPDPATRSFAPTFKQLMALWDATQAPPGEPGECKNWRHETLSCIHVQDFDELLIRNRPAVLALANAKGESYALLAAVRDNDAVLSIEENSQHIALEQLRRRWAGRAWLLHRRPDVSELPLKAGDEGSGVAWLNSRFALLYPELAERHQETLHRTDESADSGYAWLYGHFLAVDTQPLPPRFGPRLLAMVKNLQRETGLEASGVVDRATLAALSEQLHPRTPRLRVPAGEAG